MAGTRANIMSSTAVRDDYFEGVLALDQTLSGITTSQVSQFLQANFPQISMRGIEQELSYYDLFALWHVIAMSIQTPPGSGRNSAHSGPVFLPWHRTFMILLEQWIQTVLGNADFGLPYWDWAADRDLPSAQQGQTQLWTADYLGEARNEVLSGRVGQMRVRLWQDQFRTLWSVQPRPLERDAARAQDPDWRTLPTTDEVRTTMNQTQYDEDPWSSSSDAGHRNHLEGWIDGPQLHNLVHVWVGGDMGPGTSPNDPVFFLNHCNVDRIWESWMANRGRVYQPQPGDGPAGHRLDDAMYSLFGETRTPLQVLDPSPWYDYDSLTVA